jgi:6-phosphogluconolactonase
LKAENKPDIFQTHAGLFHAAAQLIVATAKKAVDERGLFSISLSGGSTPTPLYRLLAAPPFLTEMPWNNTVVFWGDERCVPFDDPRNNAAQATSTLLDKVPVAQENIYPIPVNLPPKEAAFAYENVLRTFFGTAGPRLDLILLGLGENGHTASLFPRTPIVQEQMVGVRDVYVQEEDLYRITMTAPLINLARNILFLVTGKAKADVLETVLHGPYQPVNFPAQLIRPLSGNLFWYVDEEVINRTS